MRASSVYLSAIFLFVGGCKDNSPTEPNVAGAFVVESFSATSIAGTNPVTGQNASQLTSMLQYHFVNLPGTINSPSFVVNSDTISSVRQVSYYDSYPPDTSLANIQTVWLAKHISAQDSLYVHISVWATFWTRVSKDSIKYYGALNWQDSVKINVSS